MTNSGVLMSINFGVSPLINVSTESLWFTVSGSWNMHQNRLMFLTYQDYHHNHATLDTLEKLILI